MLDTYSIIVIVIVLIVLFFIIRYVYELLFNKTDYYPEYWKYLDKKGLISRTIKKLEQNYPDKARFFQIWMNLERIKRENIPGALAEVGVYKGELAKIIHKVAEDRELHLFDSFSGFYQKDLDIESGEAATYSHKNFADTSLESVKRYIDGNNNVIFHPGYFPDTTIGIENHKFSFVSIDVDLRNPTKAALEFFYPRLSKGGVIIIDDYSHKWPGLMEAVNEFIKSIPEPLIELIDRDGSVMIIKQ